MRRTTADLQDGFTLIELLVVIVILGILAAIVVFAVGGITDKGQSSACKADKKTFMIAEEAYFAQPVSQGGGNGHYGDEDSLVPNFLRQASSLWDVDVAAGGKSYSLSAQAGSDC